MQTIEATTRNSFLAKHLAQTLKTKKPFEATYTGKMRRLWRLTRLEARKFLSIAKYFLIEERCRKCDRFIHPHVPFFEKDRYSPPGIYWIQNRRFRSDVLCIDCCNVISIPDVIRSTVDIEGENRLSMTIKVFSGTEFEGTIKKLIWRFKFEGDLGLLDDLSFLIWKAWNSYCSEGVEGEEPPVLVPVPLNWWRQQIRGFNQSELLAFALAKLLKLKVIPNALVRHRRTKTQHALPRNRRLENVKKAFRANTKSVAGKSVILIDDVCTSGSTISECARTLFEAGAKSVTALTLAKVRLNK